jgi:hypothetical protein
LWRARTGHPIVVRKCRWDYLVWKVRSCILYLISRSSSTLHTPSCSICS